MKLTSIIPGTLLGLLALVVQTGFAIGQPADMTWPDAVAQLAGQRSSERCVWAPHSLSLSTLTAPMLSCSTRVVAIVCYPCDYVDPDG
jgi:hypothetical protein